MFHLASFRLSAVAPSALGVLAAAAACAAPAHASLLTEWNLVVTGNLYSTSEVGGRAFVGGNLSGPASNYAFSLQASQWAGVDTLVVGGNITATNINLQAGNLRVGGSVTGHVNFNGGGQLFQDAALPSTVPGVVAELQAASAGYKALSANSTAQIPSGQPGQVKFNASPVGGLAVFNVSGASVFSNPLTQSIDLNANGATAIVINVSGTTINFNSGNFVGSWNSAFARANVIWNFYEATSISLDRAFNGAILAPNALLTNNTNIDGSVFVGGFNQLGEVHLPNFTGYVVPAPAALVALGGLLVAAPRRRRTAA